MSRAAKPTPAGTRHPVYAALEAHAPRPAGDPWYIPYWARGEWARTHGSRFVLHDGTEIVAGRVTKEGHGRPPEARQLGTYRDEGGRGTEVPAVQPEGPARQAGRPAAVATDPVAALVGACKTPQDRVRLCKMHGIDPAILDAPNPGVASMRLRNALRRAGAR